jgi:serine phosphatase RsbU (regulator of sigma subunit)/integral membrane sensor domain MASE1
MVTRSASPGLLEREPAGLRLLLAVARVPGGTAAFLADLKLWSRSATGRAAALFAVIAGAYVVGAELAWHHFSSGLAFGYPPSGVDVAALLLVARRRWPVVIAAIMVSETGVDLQHHLTLAVALASALANAVEPVTGASFVRWFSAGRRPDLGTRIGLGRFVLGAAVLGPLAGGLVGAAVSWASKGGWWPGLVLQWWAGDGIAVLVIGGPLLLWAQRRALVSSRWLELVLVVLLAAGLSVVAFRFDTPTSLLFLPILAWAALRLRDLGVVLAGAAFAAVANYMTAAGYGEFAHLGLSSAASVAVTQAYIALVVLLGWVLAQEVAGRMSAVQDRDSARLELAMAEARREAERREHARVETLADLTRLLAAALTPEAIGEVVADCLGAAAGGADALCLGVISQDGRRLAWITTAGEVRERLPDLPMDVPAAATDAVRTGSPVIIRTPAEYEQRYPGPDTPAILAPGSSWLTWPLRAGAAPVGAIGLMWRHPQQFEPGQLAFVAAAADLVAQALVRARVYADEHAIAAVLQRAIMPAAVAVIPGLEIGASYRQAGTTQQIGGDWYDAMALPGQRAYLAVGDVVGHGLAAAEDMTQLRNAGRTLAIAGYQPAGILDELARVTDWATSGKFATVAAAIIEPDVSLVTYATAGHPPILIRRAKTGTVEIPPPAGGPALCLPGERDLPRYTQGQTGFDVGDIMLMYTDGLIERRGEDLEEGITRVAGRLQAWPPGAPLGSLCDELIACLGTEPQLDDMCVLAVCRPGSERVRRVSVA